MSWARLGVEVPLSTATVTVDGVTAVELLTLPLFPFRVKEGVLVLGDELPAAVVEPLPPPELVTTSRTPTATTTTRTIASTIAPRPTRPPPGRCSRRPRRAV